MPCPHCAVTTTHEQAKRTAFGSRAFRCRPGKRTFHERTGTPFNLCGAKTASASQSRYAASR